MNARMWVSRLADGGARTALARWLLVGCVVGFLATMVALAGLGYGFSRAIFALVVWGVLIFLPLRIAVEASGPYASRVRQAIARQAAADPRRYDRPELIPFVVRDLFARTVTMPRIAKPSQGQKAREAAAAILGLLAGRADAATVLGETIRTALAAVAAEAIGVSAVASGSAAKDIQARWEGARALSALGALVAVLAAAYVDRWGQQPEIPQLPGRPLGDFLDAILDYADEAALRVDAMPWTEPALGPPAPAVDIDRVRTSWLSFVAAGGPAPRALEAFLASILPSSIRAPGPG